MDSLHLGSPVNTAAMKKVNMQAAGLNSSILGTFILNIFQNSLFFFFLFTVKKKKI